MLSPLLSPLSAEPPTKALALLLLPSYCLASEGVSAAAAAAAAACGVSPFSSAIAATAGYPEVCLRVAKTLEELIKGELLQAFKRPTDIGTPRQGFRV